MPNEDYGILGVLFAIAGLMALILALGAAAGRWII